MFQGYLCPRAAAGSRERAVPAFPFGVLPCPGPAQLPTEGRPEGRPPAKSGRRPLAVHTQCVPLRGEPGQLCLTAHRRPGGGGLFRPGQGAVSAERTHVTEYPSERDRASHRVFWWPHVTFSHAAFPQQPCDGGGPPARERWRDLGRTSLRLAWGHVPSHLRVGSGIAYTRNKIAGSQRTTHPSKQRGTLRSKVLSLNPRKKAQSQVDPRGAAPTGSETPL